MKDCSAELARQRNYCRPTMVEEPALRIIDGRHPVLDVIEPDGKFVPNDTIAGRCETASGSRGSNRRSAIRGPFRLESVSQGEEKSGNPPPSTPPVMCWFIPGAIQVA